MHRSLSLLAKFLTPALAAMLTAGAFAQSAFQTDVAVTARISRKLAQDTNVRQAAYVLAATAIADTDGYALPPKPTAGTTLVGGGLVPTSSGAPTTDGFGVKLGYCAWDNGTNTSNSGYIPGTNSISAVTLAVVSPGADNQFSTTCAQIAAGQPAQGDDFYVAYTGAQILSGVQGTAYFADPVNTTADFSNIAAGALKDGQVRLVKATNQLYRYTAASGTWTPVTQWLNSTTPGDINYTAGNVSIGTATASRKLSVASTGVPLGLSSTGSRNGIDLVDATTAAINGFFGYDSGTNFVKVEAGAAGSGIALQTAGGAVTVASNGVLNAPQGIVAGNIQSTGNFTVAGLLTANGGLSATSGTFSGLVTANGGISATSASFSGLVQANGGLTAAAGTFSGTLTANAGLVATTGNFSGLLTANGGIASTNGTFSGLLQSTTGYFISSVGIGTSPQTVGPNGGFPLAVASQNFVGIFNSINSSSTNVTSSNGAGLYLQNVNATPGNYQSIEFLDAGGRLQGSMGMMYGAHTGQSQGTFYIEPRIVSTPSAFVVAPSGNVGIGVTAPLAPLQVVGGSVTAAFQQPTIARLSIASGNGGYTGNGASLMLDSWTNKGGANTQPVAGISAALVNGGGGGNDYSGSLTFSTKAASDTAPVQRMLIDQNGNVGVSIGSDALASRLQVGSVADAKNVVGVNGSASSYTAFVANSAFGSAVSVFSNASGSVDSFGMPTDTVGIASYNSKPLVFGVNQTERMRIDSAGNVGIGTTSPSYALSIASNTSTTGGQLLLTDTGDNKSWRLVVGTYPNTSSPNAANSFSIYEHGLGQRFTINAGGNVGIGTANPGSKLQVIGSVRSDLGNVTGASLVGTGGLSNFQVLHSAGSQLVTLMNSTGGGAQMAFAGQSGENMRIDANGNVGIGTTAPLSRFDVAIPMGYQATTGREVHSMPIGAPDGYPDSPSGTYGIIVLGENASGNSSLVQMVNGRFNVTRGDGNSYNKNQIVEVSFQRAYNSTAGTYRDIGSSTGAQKAKLVSFTYGGKNYIGLTFGLASAATINFDGKYLNGGDANVLKMLINNQVSAIVDWKSYESVNATEDLIIDKSGNLGVGTLTPASKLDVRGTASISIAGAAAGSSYDTGQVLGLGNLALSTDSRVLSFGGFNDGAGYIRNPANTAIGIAVGNLERARFDNLGRFGIGTNAPSEMLTVAGNGRFGGNITAAGASIGYQFVSGAANSHAFYKLATLPPSSDGTFDHINIEAVVNDNWRSGYNRVLRIVMANRDAFAARQTVEGPSAPQNARILASKESDGSISIYAYLQANTYSTVSLQVKSSVNVTLVSSPTAVTSISGTNVFDSSTATPAYMSDASYNFSIGATTNPNQRLAVNDSQANGVQIGLNNTASNAASLAMVAAGSSGYGVAGWASAAILEATSSATGGLVMSSYNGPFIVQTNSRTERMRVDSSGNVGIGNTAPAWNSAYRALSIGSGGQGVLYGSTNGTGFGTSAGQVGLWQNSYYNSSNQAIAIGTGGGSGYIQGGGYHLWYSMPSVNAGSVQTFNQTMTLDVNGNLGIGTSAPISKLQVGANSPGSIPVIHVAGGYSDVEGVFLGSYSNGGAILDLNAHRASNEAASWRMKHDYDSSGLGNLVFQYADVATSRGSMAYATKLTLGSTGNAGFTGNVSATGFTTTSDRRFKNNIQSLSADSLMAKFMLVRPVEYNLIATGARNTGYIAQEIQELFPDMVSVIDKEGHLGVTYTQMIPIIHSVVQKQQKQIQDLQEKKLDNATGQWIASADKKERLYFEAGGKTVLRGHGDIALEIHNAEDSPIASFMRNGDMNVAGVMNFTGATRGGFAFNPTGTIVSSLTPGEIVVSSSKTLRAAVRLQHTDASSQLAAGVVYGMLFGDETGVGLANGAGKAMLTASTDAAGGVTVSVAGQLVVGDNAKSVIRMAGGNALTATGDGALQLEGEQGVRVYNTKTKETVISLGSDGAIKAKRFVPTDVVEANTGCDGQVGAIARDTNGQPMVCAK